jgi:GDPmannose 4,6-dehydratase
MRKALITGVTGQDGSYLAELLHAKGYEVHGLVRRRSDSGGPRATPLFLPHHADLADGARILTLLRHIEPDEVYHLGAQTDVRASFDEPELTGLTTGLGTTRLLEAIRIAGLDCRVFHAASADMFGSTPPPQHENTPFAPRSPYGAAKVYAYWMTRTYREAHGVFAVNGILFNHESPRRGTNFVTRKISRAAARIKAGLDTELRLGDLDAVRDWGYAEEYVEGMWRTLQCDEPQDYVLATGTAHTVRDFVTYAFAHVGLDWQRYVRFDEHHLRPTSVHALIGDASRAVEQLGWKARTLTPALAALMVDADLDHAMAEAERA